MIDDFYEICLKLKIHNNIYIGYSGGLDSSVLLNLCVKQFKQSNFNIHVINLIYSHNKHYINWLNFCKNQSEKYKIPIFSIKINSTLHKNNIEQHFRIDRYQEFLNNIFLNSSLLLAHNKSDLIETFFMNIFRGAGPFGTKIKQKYKYKNINILRPLLIFNRLQILNYALNNKVDYIIDFSNLDIVYNRNFVRHKVYPIITSRWENFELSILRHLNINDDINFYLYSKYIFFLNMLKEKYNFINIMYLKILPSFMRHLIIRLWINKNDFKQMSHIQLLELDKMLMCKNFKIQSLKIGNYYIKKYLNNIYILKKKQLDINYSSKIITNYKFLELERLNKKTTKLFKNSICPWETLLYPIIKHNNCILIIAGLQLSIFFKKFINKKFIIKFLF